MNDENLIRYDSLKSLKTTQEADSFAELIDSILPNLFKIKDSEFEDILSKTTGKSNSTLIKNLLEENKITQTDHTGIKRVLVQVRDIIKKFKVVKLTVAIDPTEQTISRISEWVYKNYGPGNLLDIETDESILGGAIVSIGGFYKDFSLKKAIGEVFTNNKKDLIGSLTK